MSNLESQLADSLAKLVTVSSNTKLRMNSFPYDHPCVVAEICRGSILYLLDSWVVARYAGNTSCIQDRRR